MNRESTGQNDVQKVKEKLSRYRETELEIDSQIERLERLEAKMYGVGSPQITDMPKAKGVAGDRISEQIAEKEELEQNIRSMINYHSEQRKKIEGLVGRLRKADQKTVIRMRYLDGEKWCDISQVLFHKRDDYEEKEDNYLRTVGNIHGRALLNISKMVEEDTKEM